MRDCVFFLKYTCKDTVFVLEMGNFWAFLTGGTAKNAKFFAMGAIYCFADVPNVSGKERVNLYAKFSLTVGMEYSPKR